MCCMGLRSETSVDISLNKLNLYLKNVNNGKLKTQCDERMHTLRNSIEKKNSIQKAIRVSVLYQITYVRTHTNSIFF